MTSHSPLPWFITPGGTGICDNRGEAILVSCGPDETAETDIRFVNQVVNSHAALVEAMKGLEAEAVAFANQSANDPEDWPSAKLWYAINKARAALKLAGEGA